MKQMINIAKGFQTSVNIAFDLGNEEKVRGFIPTQSSLDIIEDVLLSTSYSSTQRARILIGAYGRGKSHIVLVLLSMLFNKDAGLFRVILNKMQNSNPDLYHFAIDYLKSEQKILPIIVRGSSASLSQSFLSALQQTLNEESFSDLMPETHYSAALNQISIWKEQYSSTYEQFCQVISKSITEFTLSLGEFDPDAYEEFVQLYPRLTSGSSFNPFLGLDVVDLYWEITQKLQTKGISGIYVIYDEFSKYMESSLASAPNSDIKLLQDFAEKCTRSGDHQMHLMLISHKDIANYIDGSLPKDKVDGWRGVSGRFKHINLHNNYSQTYEIISSAINKDEFAWEKFKEKYNCRFEDLKDINTKNGLLNSQDREETDCIVEGCYPLHPVSTFILPRLSEKVAQNERTLFTFLASEENFTLPAFLKQIEEEFSLLAPDNIYDYFEPLFRKEAYNTDIFKIYKLTQNILRKVENKPLHKRIIKTIALIYLVEQFEKLPPTVDIISGIYRDSVKDISEIHDALNELMREDCIVYLKRSNNFLKLKESSGVNIEEEIAQYIQNRLLNKKPTEILNNSVFDSFIYPTSYNENNDIIRYFDVIFLQSKDYWRTEDWSSHINASKADGILFAIIPDSQSEIGLLESDILQTSISNELVVFALPKKYRAIEKDILEYAAVVDLKAESEGDEILQDDYEIFLEDLSEVVSHYHDDFLRPENGNVTYYHLGQIQNLRRKAQLSGLLSNICNDVFFRTPRVNNESINKNDLPAVAINSRTKIINGLLANDLAPNLGLIGNGQDVSIMRSTLILSGVLQNCDTDPSLVFETPDPHLNELLKDIHEFFTKTASGNNSAKFSTLYSLLTSPHFGYGVKRGVIPIYIASVLHTFKNNVVVMSNDTEVRLTSDLLNDINEAPEKYSAVLEDWNGPKMQYISNLEHIFSAHTKENEKAFNQFTYILRAMNRWYFSLPKYAKELTVVYDTAGNANPLDIRYKKFVNSLKSLTTNPREFLFEKVFMMLSIEKFDESADEVISSIKNTFDYALQNLTETLILRLKGIFSNISSQASLLSVMKDWYEDLNVKTKQYLFPTNENRILDLISESTNDENSFIESISKLTTSLRLEDWNSETVEIFIEEIRGFKRTVEDLNSQEKGHQVSTDSYEIIFTDESGTRIPRRFEKTAYSERAKLLRNEMATNLQEYGQSISEQEKRQVLIELLADLC